MPASLLSPDECLLAAALPADEENGFVAATGKGEWKPVRHGRLDAARTDRVVRPKSEYAYVDPAGRYVAWTGKNGERRLWRDLRTGKRHVADFPPDAGSGDALLSAVTGENGTYFYGVYGHDLIRVTLTPVTYTADPYLSIGATEQPAAAINGGRLAVVGMPDDEADFTAPGNAAPPESTVGGYLTTHGEATARPVPFEGEYGAVTFNRGGGRIALWGNGLEIRETAHPQRQPIRLLHDGSQRARTLPGRRRRSEGPAAGRHSPDRGHRAAVGHRERHEWSAGARGTGGSHRQGHLWTRLLCRRPPHAGSELEHCDEPGSVVYGYGDDMGTDAVVRVADEGGDLVAGTELGLVRVPLDPDVLAKRLCETVRDRYEQLSRTFPDHSEPPCSSPS
ncbi:hypothetical protein [Streptomyces sp. NPDC050164]|uniref:hypothetical protein n=1 Tax=Streptomyces sp. NPDC050164 TaxID=3365605 RepID=UPI00379CFD70